MCYEYQLDIWWMIFRLLKDNAVDFLMCHYSPNTGMNLGMGSANERWHYILTLSLIGCAHTQKYPRNIHVFCKLWTNSVYIQFDDELMIMLKKG